MLAAGRPTTLDGLVCPRDRRALRGVDDQLRCDACGTVYPVIQDVPILIDDSRSVFAVADYTAGGGYQGASYGAERGRASGWRQAYRRLARRLAEHSLRSAVRTDTEFVTELQRERPTARILIIGAGETDYGEAGVVYTDVAFGRRVQYICDAQALPFGDAHFDGVVAVAVLEHVTDPYGCVDEIRRVLRHDGLVYAATPFLQPVHMGAHDFTRFTYLGHRRLFRWFDDIESGVALGPAASVAFVLQHVLLCVSDRIWWRRLARIVGLLGSPVIKQADRLLRRRRGAYDAAAGVMFCGRKRAAPLSDREIIGLYRGGQV